MSIFATAVGLFLIYNAMSLSVVERTHDIGTIRALGARPAEVMAVFVLEAGLLGALAAFAGTAAGALLARTALAQAGNTLRIITDIGELRTVVPPDVWLTGPLLGALVASIGAWVPARAAARVAPIAALRDSAAERRAFRALPWFIAGLASIAACFVLVRHSSTAWPLIASGLTIGFAGAMMTAPQITLWLARLVSRVPPDRIGLPAWLAIDNLLHFPARTALTVVAFGGSLSLIVAMRGMVTALEYDVRAWMDDVFVFDLSAQMNDLSATPYPAGSFPGELLDEARRDPRCRRAWGVRSLFVPFNGDEVMLLAIEQSPLTEARIDRGVSGNPAGDRRIVAALAAGEVAVSSNFAELHGVGVGDDIGFETPAGPHRFRVAAVIRDHSWFRGVVFVERAHYRRLWNDASLSYLDIEAAAGVDVEAYRAALIERWSARYALYVHRGGDIKAMGLRLMREWFHLADAQLLLAVVIGAAGVANTLTISVLTQSRQIGLLRAIGASAGQVRRMLAAEALSLGLAGGLTGCLLGWMTLRFVLLPLAIRESGTRLEPVLPLTAMGLALSAALLIALAAALLPLRAVRRLDIVRAIGYE